jgi:hypothetical protein
MPTPTTYPQAAAAIVDQAFILMERSPPSSFGDDSPEALDAARHYPEVLQSLLESTDWSFAARRIELSQVQPPSSVFVDPATPHFYQLPGDVVLLREVGTRRTVWRREAEYLRASDPGPLPIRYTGRITNEQAVPASFRKALATELALRLAPRWLGTASKIENLYAMARADLQAAQRADRAQASPAEWGNQGSGWWADGIQR